MEGAHRFLKRLWALAATHSSRAAQATYDGPWEGRALEIRRLAHKCVRRVGESIERLSFNTAIAGVMECLNGLGATEALRTEAEAAAMGEAVRLLALVMTPFAPHLADELSEAYGARSCTVALVRDDLLPYAVQVNGKLRAEVQVDASAGEAEVRAAAEAEEKVQAHLQGRALRKVVFVPRRLINFVVG